MTPVLKIRFHYVLLILLMSAGLLVTPLMGKLAIASGSAPSPDEPCCLAVDAGETSMPTDDDAPPSGCEKCVHLCVGCCQNLGVTHDLSCLLRPSLTLDAATHDEPFRASNHLNGVFKPPRV